MESAGARRAGSASVTARCNHGVQRPNHARKPGSHAAHVLHRGKVTAEGGCQMEFDNTVIAKRYMEEICSRGNFAMLEELVAKDVILRDSVMPERRGHDQIRATIHEFRTAFPDLVFKIEDVLSTTSDRVVVRWTVRGTHKGHFMGLAATGRPATFKGIDILKIVDGTVHEDDAYWDAYGLFQQLGVLPRLDELSRAKPQMSVGNRSGSHPALR